MSTRPAPALRGDVVPSPAEFAGWPSLGPLTLSADAGGARVRLEGADARLRDSLTRWADPPRAASGAGADSEEGVVLECARAGRPSFLAAPAAGDRRTRLLSWEEDSGHAMATHHAALLMDAGASRGILLLADVEGDELDRALQNALRVCVAWHLGVGGRGLLLHAGAVHAPSGAVLFVGASGAGKSTACRLASPWPVLADDVAVLRRPPAPDGRGPWRLHPSPLWAEPRFPGRSPCAEPVPVRCLARIEKAASPRLAPLPASRAAALVAAHAPFASAFDASSAAADLASDVEALVLAFPMGECLSALLGPRLASRRTAVSQEKSS